MRLVMKLSAFLLSCVIGAAAMAQTGLQIISWRCKSATITHKK